MITAASTISSTDCLPRFGTPRNYSRETLGGQVAKVAEQLGTPLMPWQRHVADVAFEIDPATGLLWYGEIDLTVPRQSGKTTLILSIAVFRALAKVAAWAPGPQNIVYTAQTRNDARKKWEDDHVEALKRSIFKSQFSVRLANGAEAIKWRNGSKHGITAATEKSGHGSTLDLGFVDEAFAQIDTRQEQAMKPAMITRDGSQLWVVSTAGTPASTYLRGKVDRGRKRVLDGQPSRVAFFEWSAPEDADPGDHAVWWACMPALGHTVSLESIQAEYDGMELDDFARAYLNQWRDGKAPARVISETDWTACRDELSQLADPENDPISLAVDSTPDQSFAALAMAGIRADGMEHAEVINHRPGLSWVVPRCVEIAERRNVTKDDDGNPCITLDPAGTAGSLIPEFEAAGWTVTKSTARDMAQACGALYSAIVPPPADDNPADDAPEWVRTFRHRGQASLDAAIGSAIKRPLGDAWAWSRKATGDICPLVAVTLARFSRARYVDDGADYDVLSSFY